MTTLLFVAGMTAVACVFAGKPIDFRDEGMRGKTGERVCYSGKERYSTDTFVDGVKVRSVDYDGAVTTCAENRCETRDPKGAMLRVVVSHLSEPLLMTLYEGASVSSLFSCIDASDTRPRMRDPANCTTAFFTPSGKLSALLCGNGSISSKLRAACAWDGKPKVTDVYLNDGTTYARVTYKARELMQVAFVEQREGRTGTIRNRVGKVLASFAYDAEGRRHGLAREGETEVTYEHGALSRGKVAEDGPDPFAFEYSGDALTRIHTEGGKVRRCPYRRLQKGDPQQAFVTLPPGYSVGGPDRRIDRFDARAAEITWDLVVKGFTPKGPCI